MKIKNFKLLILDSLVESVFQLFPIYKYKISGYSMLPSLHPGDIVLVSRMLYMLKKPQAGDLIVLKDPRDGKILVKRIAKIEEGKYVVVGDNPEYSTDSRVFGMIEKKDIVGKVIFVEDIKGIKSIKAIKS